MTTYNNSRPVYLHPCGSYNYSEVKAAVEKIGSELKGGWKAFIPDGAKVLLKPNLLIAAVPEKAVTTHPSLVRAVAEICRDAGASEVMVGDSPALGSTRKVAQKAGVFAEAEQAAAKIAGFTESVRIDTPAEFMHRSFTIAREAVDADLIINLPKFKTHALMVLTLSVKNLYGLFVGKQKMRWHMQSGRDYAFFARLLLELAYSVKPSLSIIDAVEGMEGNGPSSGTPRHLGFIGASEDMLSLDRVCSEIVGIPPDKNHCLRVAREIGFNTDLAGIEVCGASLESFKTDSFKPAATMAVEGPPILKPFVSLIEKYCTIKPFLDKSRCKGCGICMAACPPRAISQAEKNTPVLIDPRKCIRCFCCQELCPEGAIHAGESIGVKLMKLLGLE